MPHQELVGPPVSRAGTAKPSVLSRIGQGLVSFGSGIPQSQIETIRSERDIAANQVDITVNQAELGRQEIEANQEATRQQQETQRLVGIVQQGNAEQSRQAADRLFQLNPELADTLFENMGATSSAQREDASRRASEILQTAPQDREAVILQQAETLRTEGRDPRDTLSLIGQSPEAQDRALNIVQSAALSTQQRFLLPADTEATKTFREGNNFVTRKIVNGRPDMSEAGILSSSPIDRIQRIETGDPGAFTGKTPSQQGQAIDEFQNAAIGGLSAIQTGAELLEIAAETPEALGAPGTIVRAGNEFIRTAEALGNLIGVDVGADRSADDFTFEGFSGNLRNTAIESQAFRSGIFGIAFAAAVAEQGSRPTDKDIQAFIDQIAGSTADPLAFRRTIGNFVNRINRRLRSTASIKGIPDQISARVFGEIDAALEQFGQAGKSQAELLPGFNDLSAEDQRELIEAIRRNPALLQGLQ